MSFNAHIICFFVIEHVLTKIMFPLGFLIHSSNNVGIVKTGTMELLGFGHTLKQNSTFEPFEIMLRGGKSLRDPNEFLENQSKYNNKNRKVKEGKSHKKQSKNYPKKCIHKLFKKKGKKQRLLKKKFLLPLLVGFLAAKSLLLPLALKALAFVSFKGLMIGFFSATILSLRGILSHPYGHP